MHNNTLEVQSHNETIDADSAKNAFQHFIRYCAATYRGEIL